MKIRNDQCICSNIYQIWRYRKTEKMLSAGILKYAVGAFIYYHLTLLIIPRINYPAIIIINFSNFFSIRIFMFFISFLYITFAKNNFCRFSYLRYFDMPLSFRTSILTCNHYSFGYGWSIKFVFMRFMMTSTSGIFFS